MAVNEKTIRGAGSKRKLQALQARSEATDRLSGPGMPETMARNFAPSLKKDAA